MKKLLFLFAVLLFTFSACQKEEIIDKIDTTTKPDPTEYSSNPLVSKMAVADGEDGIDLGCFTIDFTFEMNVNGETVSIASEDDFTAIWNDWDPVDSTFSVDFVYPFNISYANGETATISNETELGDAFASCIPDEGWPCDSTEINGFDGVPAFLVNFETSCYELTYPVALTDGTNSFTANNEEEFVGLIASNDLLYFGYPITLVGEDGISYTANDASGLMAVFAACFEFPGGGTDSIDWPIDSSFSGFGDFGCYQLVFPVSYINADGDVVVAEDENALTTAIMNANLVTFSFPITLQEGDLDPIVVNSEEELMQAIFECGGGVVDPGGVDTVWVNYDLGLLFTYSVSSPFDSIGTGCYDIVYPIEVISEDGVTVSLANEELVAQELYNNNSSELVYPVSVILTENSETVVIENIDELNTLISNCN